MKRLFSASFFLFLVLAVAAGSFSYAAGKDKLMVKAATTSEYIRLQFYSPQGVSFKTSLNGSLLRITFTKGFTPDLVEARNTLQNEVDSATTTSDGKTLIFKLKDENVTFRKFMGEDFIGLDIIRKSSSPASVKEAKNTLPDAAEIENNLQRVIALNPKANDPKIIKYDNGLPQVNVAELPAKLTKQAVTDLENPEVKEAIKIAQAISPAAGATSDNTATPAQEPTPSATPATDSKPAAKALISIEDKKADKTLKAADTTATPAPHSETASEGTPAKDAEENADIATETPPTAQEMESAKKTIEGAQTITDIDRIADGKKLQEEAQNIEQPTFIAKAKLVFNLGEENRAAAIFTRGDYLWAVFDSYKEIDINKLIGESNGILTSGNQIANKSYTITRFKMSSNINQLVEKDGNNWIVTLTESKITPESEPEISMTASELIGSKITISGKEYATPLRMIDPEVGDEIVIITSSVPIAIKTKRSYTDFIINQTAQGGMVKLLADNVDISLAKNGIEIAGPTNKLAGSAQAALRELQEKEKEAKLLADKLLNKSGELTLIQFQAWKKGGDATYKKDLIDLEWAVTEANWADKNKPRLELARFYFAHGLYPEALGVIRVIREYDEEFAKSPDVTFLEGAAYYMSGKYKEAVDIFNAISKSSFKDRELEEYKFWQAAANLQITNQIKTDKFITSNPLKEKKEDDIEGENELENTKLIRDTSSRLLKIIRKMDPEFLNSDELQKLESTARFVTTHYQEAIKRFEESDLFNSGSDAFQVEENRLWWSTTDLHATEGVSLNFTDNIDSFLKYYPDEIYNDFAMLDIEDRLKKNDLVLAEKALSGLREEKRIQQKNSIAFLTGLFNAKDEEDAKAIETWNTLVSNPDDAYNRTRAQFALTVFLLKKKEITLTQAIERLNTIRSSWRGGVLEFNVLKLLGEFYMDEKKYMEGFKVWRSTIAAFPGSDEALIVAKKMSDQFVQIFSQGEADAMPKFEALTLYYEFRELTPIGKLGDEMVGKLADRLIEVDLLDRAAALLTHQVRFRLTGEERQKAVIKLVKVHLMNHKPQDAFDALKATDDPSANEEIKTERQYLEALSLIELGKNNKVLALLKGNENHPASFLRADVYWQNQIWRKVVEELETPFREIRRDERTLTKEEEVQLLRLAVSYALTDNKRKLKVLYEDFVDFIPTAESQKIFTFVATDQGPVDYRDLDQTVEYNKIKDFLGKYIEATKASSPAQQPPENTAPAGNQGL